MRDGIKGWKKAGYPVVSQEALLNNLIDLNKIDFAAATVSEADARKLSNSTLVDFRDKALYDKGHVEGANHVDYLYRLKCLWSWY